MKARYVVSHTGKKGGPWERSGMPGWGYPSAVLATAAVWVDRAQAEKAASFVQKKDGLGAAKVFRLVKRSNPTLRALRDEVVQTAIAWEVEREERGVCSQPCCTKGAQRDHVEAVNALRARLPK